jgi:hypothetical protein
VQQIQIEVVGAEMAEASLASTRHAVSRQFVGLHFGNQEYAVALTGDYVAYQFLRAADVSIRVIPSEMPVRSAASSRAAGCLPCPRCQEP